MSGINLNRKLTLETAVRTADGAGGYAESWTALGTHWAQVTPRSGRTSSQGEAPVSRVATEIIVRGAPVGAVSRPVADQRFREGNRLWRVLAVAEADGTGRYLRCDTVEEAVA